MTDSMFALPQHDRRSEWTPRSLRSLLKARSERGRPELPLLTVARERGVFVRSPDDDNHNAIPEDLSSYKVAREGDLVVNKMKAWQGSLGLAPVDGIVSPAYFVFQADLAVPKFGEYLLRSQPYVAEFGAASDGVRIGQWDLNIPRMRRIEVALPNADEQAAIVKYLAHANARIDKAIAAKRRLIDLLEEEKMALLARVIGEATGVIMRLKHVASIQTGLTLGKDYGEQPLSEYPYLRVANVQMGHVDTTDVATVAVPTAEAERCTLRAGDVLMTEGGDIDKLGRGTVWDSSVDGCLHQNHVFAVRCGARLLPEFLAAWLAAPEPRFYFYVTAKKTTNLAATNSTTVRELPMVVPPVYEQRRLLALLSAQSAPVDLAKAKAAREIELLREFRGRLVADVVTGQVDVRELAGSLPEAAEVSTAVGILNDAAELEIKGVLEMSEV